jgi:hypothetical protein
MNTEIMNNIDNLLCIFCRNSTIISSEKPGDCIFNKSIEDDNKTNLYSICLLCNKYSYIKVGTVLYNESFSKIQTIITDIKYDPKLISIKQYCNVCKEDRIFKMFYNNKYDLKSNYICCTCDNFFTRS